MMERFLNLFGIGSATLVDDDGDMQLVQVTEREAGRGIGDRILDKVRRVAEFGFSSVPPIDSEVLIARRGGERSLSMVIGTSHRASRPRNLKPGDTVLYDVRGRMVTLTADGIIVDGAGGQVKIHNASDVLVDAPLVRMTGDAQVDGNMRVTGELDVTGKIAGGGLISAGGDVESRAGAVSLDTLRDTFNAHKHSGVKSGGDTSGTTDKTA